MIPQIHLPQDCRWHLLLSSRKIVKDRPVFSDSSFVNPHTHGASCGTGANTLNSAWAARGVGGALRKDACVWQFADRHLVLSSAEMPMSRAQT